MKTEMLRFLPEARREGLITREFEGEVLVYDLERDKAHCLNPLAGAIWKLCDGRTTTSEIAGTLSLQQDSPVNEKVVWLGLEELCRSHLMEEPTDKPPFPFLAGLSRREAIRRIGLGAAIVLPIVASMTVPTAVQAAVSCKARCVPCSTGECCSGVCGTNGVTGCTGAGGNKCA